MTNIPLYGTDGKGSGEIEVRDEIFKAPVKESLVHIAVVAYLANQRKGQARAKTRNDVRGGGAKPWRQKGTGRARAGTINSPLWRHGGVAHGPLARDYSMKVPRKMLRGALVSALSSKVREGRLAAVENIKFEGPKTREAVAFLNSLKMAGNLLLLVDGVDDNFVKSFRNVRGVKIQDSKSLNVYEVVGSEWVLAFKDSLRELEKRLLNEKS